MRNECTSFWSLNISRIQGILVILNFKCQDCGLTGIWKNQEMIGSMPSITLLLPAGLSFSGNKMQFYSIARLKLVVDGF